MLGPSHLPLPSHVRAKDVLGLAPAEILISVILQPDFHLVRDPSANAELLCARKVKMDISVKKLNQHPLELYLQSFQMLLVGYTDIRAGAATHGSMSFWTLRSLSNLGFQIFTADDASQAKYPINSKLWDDVTLDDSIVPNFASCNLERRYELEVLMGWQCKSGQHEGRLFFVQARTPVRISSGIQSSTKSGKAVATWAKNGISGTADCEMLQSLGSEESRRACAFISAPPTYDEAVRTTVDKGLRGFTMRNAAGW